MNKENLTSNEDFIEDATLIEAVEDRQPMQTMLLTTQAELDPLSVMSIIKREEYAYAAALLQSEAVQGYTRVSDIMQAMELAAYFRKPVAWVLNHFTPTNGKLTSDSHADMILAQDRGLQIEIIYNYKPLRYLFVNGLDEPIKEHLIMDDSNYLIFRNALELELIPEIQRKNKIVCVWASMDDSAIYDRISRVKGTLEINGKVQVAYGQFLFSEAETALLTSKSNWKCYPADCLLARAKKRVNRTISGWVTSFYNTEELASMEDIAISKESIASDTK